MLSRTPRCRAARISSRSAIVGGAASVGVMDPSYTYGNRKASDAAAWLDWLK
jgi:hypothetical protein